MCVFSLHGDNYDGSLIMPLHAISETTLPGHWLMNKSQITSCFFFFLLRPHNGSQRTDSLILYDGHLES